MKILYVVGKQGDNYPKKYTSKYAPLWLKKELPNFIEFVNEEDREVPTDVSMAMYLSYKHPDDTVDCIIGDEIVSKRQLDPYDVVFVVYDATEIFNCGGRQKTCPLQVKKYENAIKNTSAFVYPYPSFQKYILRKPKYYSDLKRAGIPVAEFIEIIPKNIVGNIESFRDIIKRKGWKGIIIKPSYAAYGLGIRVFKNIDRTKNKTLKKWFIQLDKYGFPTVTVQEFIPTFGKHFEIRTYWISGKYAYSVGTLTSSIKGPSGIKIDDQDTFVSEGGKLPDKIKKKLLVLGKEVMKSIIQYPYPHPLLRIDFGCCLNNKYCDDTYFVNEVETLSANMLINTKKPVVEMLANACYSLAKKVKGKEEPEGVGSKYVAKKICISDV